MTLLPEVREELMATAARRAFPPPRERRWRRLARPRSGRGALVIALSTVCVLAVAAIALIALRQRAPSGTTATPASPSLAALEAKLAVLRRPQTAADRTYPSRLFGGARTARKVGVIPSLTRLAGIFNVAPVGPVRVYVFVRQLPPSPGPRYPAPLTVGTYVVSAFAVGVHGAIESAATPVTAATLDSARTLEPDLRPPRTSLPANIALALSIVPDWVTRARWDFTGADVGVLQRHPLSAYPQVRGNIALAAVQLQAGPLAGVTWYGASGRVVTAVGGADTRQQLQTIRSINASRTHPISPFLLAHYRLFRSTPPYDLATDDAFQRSGAENQYTGGLGLNYWQTRYVGTVTGLDGPGLWITPGTRGFCINDPEAGDCGNLPAKGDTWAILGGSTFGTGRTTGEETIAGLVPNGNPTVTVVLATGARKTVPVVDYNVFEVTVRGRIAAIIDRDTAGRIGSHSLH
jgi:hypothetical protein